MSIIAEDAEHHPDLTGPFTHMEKVKAAAGFPLLVPDSGEVMGVLFVDYRRPYQFEEGETERIQSRASELAEFISQSLQGDQGRMLRDALRMEADFRIEEARLQEIVDRLWDILGDVDIALWTQERGKRGLRIKMHAGMDRDFADHARVNLDVDSSNVVSIAFVDGKEVLIKSPQTDPGAIFNVARPAIWQRILAVPVSSEHRRLGVLCVFRRERLGFTRRERDLVRAFANLIAVTIENEDRIIALNALHDVGVRLTLATDLSDILLEVVRSACQVIGADIATVHLYDPARQEFYGLERSAVFPPEAQSGMEKPRGRGGLSARIIEQGRAYCEDVDDQEEPVMLSTFVEKQKIKAYVGTRLISIDEPLGVLYVSFKERRPLSPEELSLIQILANYASTAIYRTELLDQRAAVTEIAREITSKLDRDELIQTILEQSLRLLKCEDGSIALVDRSTGELVFQYATGRHQRERLRPGEGLTGAAVQLRKLVRVGDVTKDPRYSKHMEETRSELDVPLLVGDELVGVLNVESPRYNAFSEEDERLAMTLASQAAVALDNARLYEEARSEAIAAKQLATLGTAIAALQHRINNTFNIIAPNLTRLRKRVDMTDETIVEILDIIERNARYTASMIARIQEPLREIEAHDMDVNAVLSDIVGKVKEQWQADPARSTIAVTLSLDDSIPLIQAPIGQIAEVFRNLVDNAYRAMGDGGQLTITSQYTDGMIQVRVQDTGCGIPSAVQERLFVKPVPSKEPGGGAGLGLWLSRLMLRSIGGDVTIEKSNPTGTTMLVQIPTPGAGKEVRL
jgi:GAF domain-containing protein/anti-sigma regulatory factor (Ser/Thr protein kinase)